MKLNFNKIWKATLPLSAVLVLVALVALFLRPLNLGIEFEGGISWEVRSETIDAQILRDSLDPFGLGDARIQQVANDLWRIRSAPSATQDLETVKSALAQSAGVGYEQVSANSVGASWGAEVTAKARNALIVFFIALFVYITIRLEWKAAAAALAAVAHDIILTLGIYALFGFEVTSATVIAFLTILGYSLYDTLVVFDKIQDNERRASTIATTYRNIVSYSSNQVLTRSINTTITSLIPVISVLVVGRFILGALTLQEFALALLIGLVIGTYSSLFIATPLLVKFKERENRVLSERLDAALAKTTHMVQPDDLARALAQADQDRKNTRRAELRERANRPKARLIVGDPNLSGRPDTSGDPNLSGEPDTSGDPNLSGGNVDTDAKPTDDTATGGSPTVVVRKSVGEIKPRPKKRR